MTERDTYAFVKNLNRQGKAASKEPKKRGNDDYENVPTYAMVEMQLPSSRAIGLKEETKASKTESETSYAVVVGSHFSSPVIKTQAYNGNATGLEEDPCYSFVRSNLLSSGVNGAMENSNGIGLEEPCYLLSGSSPPSSRVNGGMENSKALETKEDLLKNGRQPTKLLIAFIITVIILLTANIALITWNAHLSNNLHQSVQHLAEKDKQIGELNISCGNLNTELQENKGNFSVLIRNIQSMFKGKELPDLRIPGTQLSNILNQSIQNLAEKDKKYVHLNITYGNLSKEMQEIKGNFSELIRNIQSVCEGKLPDLKLPDTMLSNSLYQSIQNLREKDKKCKDLNILYGNLNEELQKNKGNFADLINNIESVCEGEHHHLKIPDALLANHLYQSIQNLAEKDKKCKDLNIRNGNLNEELQENKGNFAELINNLESVCEGNDLHRLKITGEQQSNMWNILARLAAKEKYCTGLKTINENLRKEQSENKQLIGSMKCIPQENYSECCPSDWQMFKHSCYYFSQEYHNWSEAQKQCEIKQSNLVMIKSREQQDFLKSILKYKYWMGLTDADHERQWKWVDGKPCDCTGKNRLYWYSKEPDNWSSGGSSTDEDCAVIRPDGGWSDIKCTDTERWICEKVTSVCYVNKP